MSDYDNRDYEVGKGKPPKETRWKKGQSGNPKGRPRVKRDARTMSLNDIAVQIANEQIPATVNGKRVSLSRKVAALTAAFNDTLTGSPLTRSRALRLLIDAGAYNPQQIDQANSEKARQKFLARLSEEADRHDAKYANCGG